MGILKRIVKVSNCYFIDSCLILGLLFVILTGLNGQSISGKVVDQSTGTPLIGATVILNQQGSITDYLGRFSLSKISNGTLQVSYVGFENWKKDITSSGDSMRIDISLVPSANFLDITTVTASKYEKPLGESTVSLEVISQNLLKSINATSVDESLDKIPGVQIIGGQANIRGGSGYSYGAGSRVMLLLDDLPILTADAGFPNWDDLPVESVQQIEVLKGASSALYGSSALNGIVNIRSAYPTNVPVTKFSTFHQTILSPKDVNKKWWDSAPYTIGIQASDSRKVGRLDLVTGVYLLRRNPVYRNSKLSYGRFNFNTLYRLSDRFTIGLNGNFNKGNQRSYFYWSDDSSGAYIGAEGTESQADRFRYNIDPVIKYYQKNGISHKFLNRFYSIDNKAINDRSNQTKSWYSEYQISKKFEETDLNLSAGIVYNSANVTAALYGDTLFNYKNLASYLQLEKKFFDKLTISLGGRVEYYNLNTPISVGNIQVDPVLNRETKPVFRVGANYKVKEQSYIRASWGQGFRFPTIAEKFIQTTLGPTQISPNPNLMSEYGWSGEVGIKQGIKLGAWTGFVDLAAFWQEYFDMMEFQFVGFEAGFQSINVGNTRINGYEISLAGKSTNLENPVQILGGYTFINPVFQDFTEEEMLRSSADYNILKYRSKHFFKLDFETKIKKLSLGANLNYTSNMEAIDAIFELVIPGLQRFRMEHNKGYSILGVRIAYELKNWTFSLLGQNLLNQEYSIRPGLLEDPANLTFKISAEF